VGLKHRRVIIKTELCKKIENRDDESESLGRTIFIIDTRRYLYRCISVISC